jgi:hypothetical protein
VALRPPEARRPRRRRRAGGSIPEPLILVGASAVLVLLGLRIALAAIGIEEWTTAWQVVAVATFPLVKPFEPLAFLRDPVVRRLTPAELLALFIFGSAALYALATLTVRRIG